MSATGGSLVSVKPSEFVEAVFKIPDVGGIIPFSLKDRPYLYRVYDTSSPRVLLMFGRQTEKCADADTTTVIKYNGQPISLREIGAGDIVSSDGVDTPTERKVTWSSEIVEKACYKVVTEHGFVLDAGEQHPILQWYAWTPASQLIPGTRIGLAAQAGFFEDMEVSTARLNLTVAALFLEFSPADISFSFPLNIPKEFIASLAKHPDFIKYEISPDKNILKFNSIGTEVALWLMEDRLSTILADYREIPSWVFSLSEEDTLAFLSKLFLFISCTENNIPRLRVFSSPMALQIQALFLKVGIVCSINSELFTTERSKPISITLLGGPGYHFFITTYLGMDSSYSWEEEELPLEARDFFLNKVCITKATRKNIRELFRELYSTRITPAVQKALTLLEAPIYWDRVKTVTYIGMRPCRDISVEEKENFLANIFVTHNSTSTGNICLVNSILRSHFRIIYVAPRRNQSGTFSRDRIKQPIEYSETLKPLQLNYGARDNTFYKEFVSGSTIRLEAAWLNADSIRGKAADLICVDELQNILLDVLPVIEECLFHSPYKFMRYSGTPLTHTNTLAQYWSKRSTQNEWAIPCDHCGTPSTGRYWNIPGEINIGKHFLICARCGKRIYPQHEQATWVAANPKPSTTIPFEGFRVPQIITPMVVWPDLLDKMGRYDRFRFINEVLALPYDIGTKPLTEGELQEACSKVISMYSDGFSIGPTKLEEIGRKGECYCGIDWGQDGNSKTVLVIATYFENKLSFVYYKRFEGREATPVARMAGIEGIIDKYNPIVIGADYGGGFEPNDALLRKYGPKRVVRYQYADVKDHIHWNNKLGYFQIQRSVLMSALLTAIKKHFIQFPRWEEFGSPFGEDFLNVTQDWNDMRRMIVYTKELDSTDDSFHATLYCMLASMLRAPRPDILHGSYEYMQNLYGSPVQA